MAELDYRLEAANLRQLGAQLAAYDRIVVPQPVDDYTTSTVLTMDLVDGRNIGTLGPLARQDIDGCLLASQLFEAYLDQILVDGCFHADPHPGNVLLTADGGLALIDLGMVGRVGPELQDELVRLLLAAERGPRPRGRRRDGPPRRRSSEDWDQDRFERDIVVPRRPAAGADARAAPGRAGDRRARPHRRRLGPAPAARAHHAGQDAAQPRRGRPAARRGLRPQRRHPGARRRDHAAQDAARARRPPTCSPPRMDAKEFAEKLPGRVNKVMDALAEGEMTLNVKGIDEKELMRGIQKLANRVTSGLVIAALIIGAAMLMRIETESQLFGYPTPRHRVLPGGRDRRPLAGRQQRAARPPPTPAQAPLLNGPLSLRRCFGGLCRNWS